MEEYGPELRYIQGEQNIVADALSRIEMETQSPAQALCLLEINEQPVFTDKTQQECFYQFQIANNMDEEDSPECPVDLRYIRKQQQKDSHTKNLLKEDEYNTKIFHGGGKSHAMIFKDSKIVIPKGLQSKIIEWYHTTLLHPGKDRTYLTISQHLYWKGMKNDIENYVKKCPTCQMTKPSNKNYGHLPAKTAETTPWEQLCVDLVGPYKIPINSSNKAWKKKKFLELWCVTMIDPATSWFEMVEIDNKTPINIVNIVEIAWLNRYPRPKIITFDGGNEFKADFNKIVREEFNLETKPASVHNPQGNSVLERIHQVMGNMIKTFQIYNRDDMDVNDPWSGILGAVMYAIRSTVHTTLGATPMQLVFGRDAILPICHKADWKFIKDKKQRLIDMNNKRENKKRIPFQYTAGSKVPLKRAKRTKHGEREYDGPYTILQLHTNGTVRIQKNTYSEVVHLRQIKPYHE